MSEHEKRIREALAEGSCLVTMPELRALLADLDAVRGALRHADRALNNWIALHPGNKDALDTIALEAIDAALKGADSTQAKGEANEH